MVSPSNVKSSNTCSSESFSVVISTRLTSIFDSVEPTWQTPLLLIHDISISKIKFKWIYTYMHMHQITSLAVLCSKGGSLNILCSIGPLAGVLMLFLAIKVRLTLMAHDSTTVSTRPKVSIEHPNRKSYLTSQCAAPMTGSAQNRFWHRLTSVRTQ